MVAGQARRAVLAVWLLTGLAVASGTAPREARADLSKTQLACSTAIAKAGLAYVRQSLKIQHACRLSALAGGTCATPDPSVMAKIDAVLASALSKRCDLPMADLGSLGFPGPCNDDTSGGFTRYDLVDCIRESHGAIVTTMLGVEIDPSLGVLGKEDLACQQAVAKGSAGFVACALKAVQQCRLAITKNKLPGVPAHLCATADPKTAGKIAKCQSKLDAAIADRCTDEQAASLKLCAPDQPTASTAASCIVAAHKLLIDGPHIDVPPDLVDYEFAVRGGLCGDGTVNNLAEECDGDDDDACPGACGTATVPDGFFACLCKTKPRMRIVEHAEADTDNGWTGNSADTPVVESGGYVADLYDCDGFGLCRVGPSCSLPPHSPCNPLLSDPSGTTGNAVCGALGQGVCRKERTAVGPHCFQDVQKKCDLDLHDDPVCDGPGDFCKVTLAAPPNPVSSGGVTVCNVTVFSEDVVGTVNVLTGESLVRAPQRARTYSKSVGSANKPCPVCGGFCGASKERCATNTDCPNGTGPCVTAAICSDGPNAGRECRTGPPFGADVTFFGTTSVDCPPDTVNHEITSGEGLDLYVTARTTGASSMLPSVACSSPGFSSNACVGGTSEGRPCNVASECPGGTCRPQCFCAGQIRPNACGDSCVGGANDGAECVTDSECPAGFCHRGDCRLNPGDTGSIQEGECTNGPADRRCSATTFRSCLSDAECAQSVCPFCEPGETCVTHPRQCFVNSGIVRQGTPHTPEGASAAVYCIAGNNSSVNTVAGFPGPAAFTQPERQLTVP
jgi:hypothetical protein